MRKVGVDYQIKFGYDILIIITTYKLEGYHDL